MAGAGHQIKHCVISRRKENVWFWKEKRTDRKNSETGDDVIRAVGQLLCDSGYVDEGYIEAMIKRELSFPTNIGNGIALPHGVEEAKKEIKHSGIAVMVFPEGTDWGTEKVNLVIGIAGVGEDHLEILATIAEKMATPEAVEELIKGSADDIYAAFTTKA